MNTRFHKDFKEGDLLIHPNENGWTLRITKSGYVVVSSNSATVRVTGEEMYYKGSFWDGFIYVPSKESFFDKLYLTLKCNESKI